MRSKLWPPPPSTGPSLTVIPPAPPRKLIGSGRRLWDRIVKDFVIDDAGAQEVLQQVCEAVNQLESITARLRKEAS
jgi:hypothetical protein